MNARQRIEVEILEARRELRELAESEEAWTDEQRTKAEQLKATISGAEERLAAAIAAGDDAPEERDQDAGNADDADRQELLARASIGEIFSCSVEGISPSGATKELQDELKLQGNMIPLELLSEPAARVEKFTAGQTPAPSDVGASQQPIIPAVFPRAAAAYLGVQMPTVPVGDATFTIISTSVAPGTPAGGAEQAHSAGAFTATVVDPERIQGSFFIRREDRARLAGMEEALRMNLADALSDTLDSEIVGTSGLLAASNAGGVRPAANTAASTASAFADYMNLLYQEVDGIYAAMAGDVRLLVAGDVYAAMGASYRSDDADYTAVDALMRHGGGLRVSAHVPAAATVNSQTNNGLVVAAKDVGRMHAVAPLWEGVELIVDPLTQAQEGEIVITGVLLWGGFNLLRAAAFDATYVKTS
ncbi:MAG: hypothetical protein OXG38_02910 [Chloroflexi bacterium]|nr:hypothetical protein [Chloroflexota bacterium]